MDTGGEEDNSKANDGEVLIGAVPAINVQEPVVSQSALSSHKKPTQKDILLRQKMDKLSKLYRIKKTLNVKPPLNKAIESRNSENATEVKPWIGNRETPEKIAKRREKYAKT